MKILANFIGEVLPHSLPRFFSQLKPRIVPPVGACSYICLCKI